MKPMLRFFMTLFVCAGLLIPSLYSQDVSYQSYLKSRMYLSNLQPSIALTHIEVAIELNETRGEYFILRAFCWLKLDRSDLFIKDYQKALAINPNLMMASLDPYKNLPELIAPFELDTNPFIIDPGEIERHRPQLIGIKTQVPIAF